MATSHLRHQKRIASPAPHPRRSVGSSLYILWLLGLTLMRLALAPLRGPVRLALILVSLWLILGVSWYSLSYVSYAHALQERNALRTQAKREEQQWRTVLSSHPTSREALLGAYTAAKQLGEESQAELYLQTLRRIDPNDPRIQLLP